MCGGPRLAFSAILQEPSHRVFKVVVLIGREHANQAKRAGQKKHRDLTVPNSPKLKLQALATLLGFLCVCMLVQQVFPN